MPPETQNPLVIAAYVLGAVISLPVLTVVVKAMFFIVKASTKLDLVDDIAADVKQLRAAQLSDVFGVQLSLTVIEGDINTLQENAGIPVRSFPDRRTGPADRRAAGQ